MTFPSKHIIFGSEHKTLVFESDKLYKQFVKEDRELHEKFYKLICETSGIWASNQNKFVKTIQELNDWDTK